MKKNFTKFSNYEKLTKRYSLFNKKYTWFLFIVLLMHVYKINDKI